MSNNDLNRNFSDLFDSEIIKCMFLSIDIYSKLDLLEILCFKKQIKKNMSISEEQLDAFKAAEKLFIDDVHIFGGNDELLPCKRLKRPIKQHKVLGTTYTSYQIIEKLMNERLDPPLNEEASHICGKEAKHGKTICVEGTHIKSESHPTNQSRRECHDNIRKWIAMQNQHTFKRWKTRVPKCGPVYVSDIPKLIREKGWKKYKLTDKITRSYVKKDADQRKSARLKRQKLKRKIPSKPKTLPMKCTHTDNPCFINHGKHETSNNNRNR